LNAGTAGRDWSDGWRSGDWRGRDLRSGQFSSKLLVVSGPFLWIEQANSRCREFVQQALAEIGVFAGLERPQMGHLPIGRAIDRVGVRLELPNTEQAVVIRRLFFRRDSKPNMIRIEIRSHCRSPVCRRTEALALWVSLPPKQKFIMEKRQDAFKAAARSVVA
jgi:hypothetical protein